jgi:hypothetical protein
LELKSIKLRSRGNTELQDKLAGEIHALEVELDEKEAALDVLKARAQEVML